LDAEGKHLHRSSTYHTTRVFNGYKANGVAGAGHVKSEIEIAAKENSKKTNKRPSNN
jgi:hypothetical protein